MFLKVAFTAFARPGACTAGATSERAVRAVEWAANPADGDPGRGGVFRARATAGPITPGEMADVESAVGGGEHQVSGVAGAQLLLSAG
ncbi:hypothetical protein [Amycolatopsis sp. NPDC051371]|uniref:hypothetical protein n=1 Tax=Amycolatopsis sp. NPDC051371 TaxID=3155800 RepID=UPI003445F9C2